MHFINKYTAVLVVTLFYSGSTMALEMQQANLVDCVNALPASYLQAKKFRICEARRGRSLLYEGTGTCPSVHSIYVPGGCILRDSVGPFTANIHMPQSVPQVLVRFEDAKRLFADGITAADGGFRTVNSTDGDITVQQLNNQQWKNRCTIAKKELSCQAEPLASEPVYSNTENKYEYILDIMGIREVKTTSSKYCAQQNPFYYGCLISALKTLSTIEKIYGWD